MANHPFDKAKVRVNKRSAFDLSHSNFLTTKIGTLTPVYTEAVMPGDSISLGVNFRAQLPPLASNFLGDVDIRYNAFFVPNRLLVGRWQQYFMNINAGGSAFTPVGSSKTYMPVLQIPNGYSGPLYGRGTLADFLGSKMSTTGSYLNLDALPFLAYHRIWRDWYRNPGIQQDIYDSNWGTGSANVSCINPVFDTPSYAIIDVTGTNKPVFNDGVNIASLRQVNYANDYFTNAYLNANGGATNYKVSVSGLTMLSNAGSNETPTMSNNGYLVTSADVQWRLTNGPAEGFGSNVVGFSINQLRSANALQRFAETNALAGFRYRDMVLANYGVVPSDALADMPIYLGGFSTAVYKNTVQSTTNNSGSSANPFTNFVGGSGASGFTMNSDTLIKNFDCKEHGFIMVVADVRPKAVYGTGTRRYLQVRDASTTNGPQFVDRFPVPSLATVGNQPIYGSEISDTPGSYSQVFGYTDRYAHLKWHEDEVHGLLSNGQNLSFMALQRNVTGSTPQLSSSFIEVPTTSMDNVTAVSGDLSTYGVVLDNGFTVKMIRPLPVYSIPTLSDDPDNTREIHVRRNGVNF